MIASMASCSSFSVLLHRWRWDIQVRRLDDLLELSQDFRVPL
jgi:hypothetical protein